MSFSSPRSVASWDWQTANDAPARDPTKWTLEGANDGTSWTVLDDTWASDAFATTSDRYTWQGPFSVTNFCDEPAGPNLSNGLVGYWRMDEEVILPLTCCQSAQTHTIAGVS